MAKEGALLGILLTLAEGIVKAPVILGLCLSVPCSRMLLRRATHIAQSIIPRLQGRNNSKTGPAPLQPPTDLPVRRFVAALPEAVRVLKGPFIGKAIDELETVSLNSPKAPTARPRTWVMPASA